MVVSFVGERRLPAGLLRGMAALAIGAVEIFLDCRKRFLGPWYSPSSARAARIGVSPLASAAGALAACPFSPRTRRWIARQQRGEPHEQALVVGVALLVGQVHAPEPHELRVVVRSETHGATVVGAKCVAARHEGG